MEADTGPCGEVLALVRRQKWQERRGVLAAAFIGVSSGKARQSRVKGLGLALLNKFSKLLSIASRGVHGPDKAGMALDWLFCV